MAYALAGVAISKGKAHAKGDNGVYLSCIVTAVLAAVLWAGGGIERPPLDQAQTLGFAMAAFALAGVFSTVLGRIAMYRSTEVLGAVAAGLVRRLTPLFAVVFGWLLLRDTPSRTELIGGALILGGVLLYLARPVVISRRGLLIGIGSAACYALAYSLRGVGLESLPDPALGALIGALVGCIWFPCEAILHQDRARRLSRLIADRTRWHWVSALALGGGQVMQFYALQTVNVAVVAVLGSLDVLFTLGFALLLGVAGSVALFRLIPALGLAILGSAILFLF